MGTNNLGYEYAKGQTYNRGNLTNAMPEKHPMVIITAASNGTAQGQNYFGVWYPTKEQCYISHAAHHIQSAHTELKRFVFQQP